MHCPAVMIDIPISVLFLLRSHFGFFAVIQLLESAFKKETVGLVTREQFVEKVKLLYIF